MSSEAKKGKGSPPLTEQEFQEKLKQWYERLKASTLPLIREYHKAKQAVATGLVALQGASSQATNMLMLMGHSAEQAAAMLAEWKEEALAYGQEVGG